MPSCFFGLWILMRYVCLPPLLRIRAQREQQVQADREAAATAETQAEQVRRDYDATIAEARAEAARIIEAARTEAEAGPQRQGRCGRGRGRRPAPVRDGRARHGPRRGPRRAQGRRRRPGGFGRVEGRPVRSRSRRPPATVDEYVNQAGGAS